MICRRDLVREIIQCEAYLQKITVEREKLKKEVPQGARLRATRHGNSYQYFIRENGTERNGTYIKKKEYNKAIILAQIEYDEKVIRILEERITDLRKWNDKWIDDPFNHVKEQMSPGKGNIIKMPYISDELFIRNWLEQKYTGVEFMDGFPEFFTRKGLRVRSKSEVIIADILDEMDVPFLYEKPLKLRQGTVHPDFTLLDLRNRREVYWEHFGMMDDMDYRNNAFFKIRKYEESGFYQHDSLIWTIETGKYPINTREVRKMIKSMKSVWGY